MIFRDLQERLRRRLWEADMSCFPPGLVGSQSLGGAQLQCSSACFGTCHARSPTKIDDFCPSCSISGPPLPPPDAKRPSRVSLCKKSAIQRPTVKMASCLKTVTISKSLEELARGVARVQGQPADKEEDSEISNEIGPLLVPKSARGVSGRRHHRLRMLVGHPMCRDGKSVKSRSWSEELQEPSKRDGIIRLLSDRFSNSCI